MKLNERANNFLVLKAIGSCVLYHFIFGIITAKFYIGYEVIFYFLSLVLRRALNIIMKHKVKLRFSQVFVELLSLCLI